MHTPRAMVAPDGPEGRITRSPFDLVMLTGIAVCPMGWPAGSIGCSNVGTVAAESGVSSMVGIVVVCASVGNTVVGSSSGAVSFTGITRVSSSVISSLFH